MLKCEVLVVGGGHAGIEAAAAAARMGHKTILLSYSRDMIGSMPCNPSIGGPAKGIVVREIDAMGGIMPVAADRTALQVKMLNTTKGPGVWSLREQSDKIAYKKAVLELLDEMENLEIVEGGAKRLIAEDQQAKAIELEDGRMIEADRIILTTGTYMDASILKGHTKVPGGPDGQPTTTDLSASLKEAGLDLFRLKTGTPPRIDRTTVDFSKASVEPGSKEFFSFSETTDPEDIISCQDSMPCYLIYTTPKTHQIIRDHLQDSAMYSGLVKGVGPRYCPSIEDKLVRFADKERHQLFLEPETADFETVYVQGFSTSMPESVQEEMVHSLPGLENAKILKYAYAIEYDAVNPLQTKPSLENRLVKNLYTAGQINGTSGYEEAAGQGLMAGANAALSLEGKDPFVLRRDEAYIGVMIDDLTTKGTNEPYRLLTSRAEYRLLLRHDNAQSRLLKKAHAIGLVNDERLEKYEAWEKQVEQLLEILSSTHIPPRDKSAALMEKAGYGPLEQGTSALELLKRPGMKIAYLDEFLDSDWPDDVKRQAEIRIRYEGYIQKALKEAARAAKMEDVRLDEDLDYLNMDNLSLEARQKLDAIRPMTMGQASRISGINPADLAVLSVAVKKKHVRDES